MVFNIILPYSYFVFTLYLQGFCNESGHLKLEFGGAGLVFLWKIV